MRARTAFNIRGSSLFNWNRERQRWRDTLPLNRHQCHSFRVPATILGFSSLFLACFLHSSFVCCAQFRLSSTRWQFQAWTALHRHPQPISFHFLFELDLTAGHHCFRHDSTRTFQLHNRVTALESRPRFDNVPLDLDNDSVTRSNSVSMPLCSTWAQQTQTMDNSNPPTLNNTQVVKS